MEFKKYPSLTNHYEQKQIGYWVEKYPELKEETYIISEKLDGGNFNLTITKDEIKHGKRTAYVEDDLKFFDWKNTIAKHKLTINKFKSYLIKNNLTSIRIFGEIFGKGIMKRVNYGEEKDFRMFDLFINEELQSWSKIDEILEELDIDNNFYTPCVAIVKGLYRALEYKDDFDSKILDEEDNIAEGIVIKPYNKTYVNENGSVFYIKKKNDKFKEKAKEPKTKKVYSTSLLRLKDEFGLYITQNRLDNLFSKEGTIESQSQIGKYIVGLMNDAKEDFAKEFGDEIKDLETSDLKFIYGKGNKLSADLVKASL